MQYRDTHLLRPCNIVRAGLYIRNKSRLTTILFVVHNIIEFSLTYAQPVCLCLFLPCSDSRSVLNVSRPDTLLLGGLLPFTLYTVQVVACTRFGCTRSPLVAAMTLESGMHALNNRAVANSLEVGWSYWSSDNKPHPLLLIRVPHECATTMAVPAL